MTLVNSSRLPIAGWALVDGRNCPAPSQATASSSPARRVTSSSLSSTRASAATRATSSVEIADMEWS
ncbi:MAG: hypothetical protein ACFNLH_09250, partial [Corynebacterium matruchotii]